MKVFISILFSLFFVRVALSDAPYTVHCVKGQYKPAGTYGCSDCHDRCGPSKYLPEYTSDCAPCTVDVSTLKYVCPEGSMTRGFYCPYDRSYSVSLNEHQGLEQCPSGFADAVANQQDDKRCYAYFHFYPGDGTTFKGATFTGDQSYDEKMYYKVDSDLFTASADGSTHKLKPEFITGASAPTNPKYYFNGWKWGKKAINGNVLWVNVDANTNIKSEGDDTEEYRHIKAKWKYKVQYHVGFSISTEGFDATSGEPYVLEENTELHAWDFVSETPTTTTLIEEGKVFKGWCVDDLSCSDTELLHPANTICDVDNCGDKTVTPTNKYVNLYAVFGTCKSEQHRVANAKTNKCICAQGYYGAATSIDEQTNCTRCPNGKTTISTGKTSVNDCIHRFTFKTSSGSTDIWAWPSSVDTSGDVSNIH